MPATLRRVLIVGIALLALWLVVYGLQRVLPAKSVVIETGPVGGSYHENALRYAQKLEAAGIRTEIRPNPQSLETIDRINSGTPRTDIGFTVQPLDRKAYPNAASVGVVELQPLFIFYNTGLGKDQTLASLRGKRLVMPPQSSASAEAARGVLGLSGVDEKNTRFTYLPIATAAEELKAGKHDAGFFMLAPANTIIRGLVTTPALSLLSIPEAVGVSRILRHLRSAVMPVGSFDLQDSLPDHDLNLLCGMVNVMVRKDIDPAVLFALLDAIKDTHPSQTLVSAKGEFPTPVGTALEIHPLAAQWAQSGTPWLFRHLSPAAASLVYRAWPFH